MSTQSDEFFAPGWPGIEPRWTSSAKQGVGTALNPASRIWYALSHGIVNEVYFPRIDQACTRDFQLLVTDGDSFFSEEKRDTETTLEMPSPGTPLFRITNRCREGRYVIRKEVFADPNRDCLIQHLILETWSPELRLHALLAPHLGNHGTGNTAWVGDHKGVPMLFAERDRVAVAFACSTGWVGRSVGFVGRSDGWQNLNREKRMTWFYERAENGNVALLGELSSAEADGEITLVLGFGRSGAEAGHHARETLASEIRELRAGFVEPWQVWQADLDSCDEEDWLWPTSAAVLRSHEDKTFPGGCIASLSIPWGACKGDGDLGGYHLVWPRDLCETASGFLAVGAHAEALRILRYLQATQEADGHWCQNMWLDGMAYWQGIQLDEVALPVLVVDLALRSGALAKGDLAGFWPMVERACTYLMEHGPVSSQDRWEEDAGCSPFTLSAEIAALLAGADLAEQLGHVAFAREAEALADQWFERIDTWTYASGTRLAKEHGVDGYYVRIAPPDVSEASSPLHGFVAIKNRPYGQGQAEAVEVISPDALALVRFGLRAPDDPRILNTVKIIDALLQRDVPGGRAWCRYNGDGYGEHEDGESFDGTGIGRPWPLLTGERAHYEVAAGNPGGAEGLRRTIRKFASATGLIPEQVWDGSKLPGKELFPGQPTGSAMPLVWAHSEYLKLCRSIRDGAVFDLPPQTSARYLDYIHEPVNPTTEFILTGEVASGGVAKGTALVGASGPKTQLPRRRLAQYEALAEVEKLDAAIAVADEQLHEVQDHVRTELGDADAEIFEAQILLLHDPVLREEVTALCLRERINVEAALEKALASLEAAFLRIADPYFRERGADLRDVGHRLMDALTGEDKVPSLPFPEDSIIVASELFPTVVAQLDSGLVRAIIVERGGQTAHATILARAKGIPLLINVAEATAKIQNGEPVIVDGVAGRAYVNPSAAICAEYAQLEAGLQARQSSLCALIDLPAETSDGTPVELRANIGKSADAAAAAQLNADGVGLYRTEFAFQVHDHFPTEQEQANLYLAAAQCIEPKPMVIRVLDIGSDKLLPYFPLPVEANPSLGCRGTRLLLAFPEILEVQLRAILRVSATHPVSVLFPMVCGIEDMRSAKVALERAKDALSAEEVDFDSSIQVGAMIETPSAAILLPKLAKEADFFCVGTNDLVQYLLATDRTSQAGGSYYEPLHPAVLYRLDSIAKEAAASGVRASICGEMAGNPAFTRLLLGLGFRSFSVNPGELLEVKNAIRNTDLQEAKAMTQELLELGTVQEIRDHLYASATFGGQVD